MSRAQPSPEQELERLRRINASLMRRVEKMTDAGGDAFGLFQNSLMLEQQVRERTVALEQMKEQLENANVRLRHDKQAAEQLAASKSAFLATMSHEIRTPLNGILGMLALVMDQELADGVRTDLSTVTNSANALKELLDSVLEYSRLDSGMREYEHGEFDLHDLCFDVTDLFREQARDQGLDIYTVVEPGTPMAVHGDVGAMRQIFCNLVGNAVKFTQSGSVRLTCRLGDGDRLEVEVSDTGIGMAPEVLQRIFDPFLQADNSTTRRYGGTGLGLAICRKLCAGMGGAIQVTSAPDEGTCFRVSLPLQKAAAAEGIRHDEHFRDVFLVENRDPVASSLRTWLEQTGIRVQRCAGREALERALAAPGTRPRCVLLPGGAVSDLPSMDRWAEEHGVDRILLLASGPERGQLAPRCGDGVRLLSDNLRPRALFEALAREQAGPQPETNPQQQRRWQGTRILVAEDNPVNQVVTRRSLERFGCTVEIVDDGRKAVDTLTAACADGGEPFDLVLMDVQMPEMDGLEATRCIRSEPSTSQARIVALTANALPGDRQMCEDAGMDGYLSKPVRLAELERLLERWCPPDGESR